MNVKEIFTLDEKLWLSELQKDPVEGRNIQKNIDYYDGKHPILTTPSRQDYSVPKYEYDDNGDPKLDGSGNKISAGSETIQRTRLVLNYQVQIIDTAVGMCVGEPVSLILNNQDKDKYKEVFDEFVDQWRNKANLDTFSIKMSRALFKESMCAEVFFIDPDDSDKDIKPQLFSLDEGDKIWPHFNDNKKLDAITREFTKRMIKDGAVQDVKITQIWTDDEMLEKEDTGLFGSKPNLYKKIPIVYYDQEKPEYDIAKELIGKQELVRSQNSDVNKRIGNPNVVIDGDIERMPEIEQDVKVFNTKPTTDNDGKLVKSSVSYLQLEGAHEAIDIEVKNYKEDMFGLTWPDLNKLQEVLTGGNISTSTMKLGFTNAFVKIVNKKEIFENFNRRVSIIKRMLAVSRSDNKFEELNISVRFNSILPENITEITDNLVNAKIGGITSQERAVSLWPANDGDSEVLDEVREGEARELGGSAG